MGLPCSHYGFLIAQGGLLLTFCQNLFQERLFEKTPSQFSLFPIYKSLKEKTKQNKTNPRHCKSKSTVMLHDRQSRLVPKSHLGQSTPPFHLETANKYRRRIYIPKLETKSPGSTAPYKGPAQESFTETPTNCAVPWVLPRQ